MAGVLSSNPMCYGLKFVPIKPKWMRKNFALSVLSGAGANVTRSSTKIYCQVAAQIPVMTETALVSILVLPSEQRRRTIARVTTANDTCQTVTSIASRANVPYNSRLPAPEEILRDEVWGNLQGVSSSHTRLDATTSSSSSGRGLSSPQLPNLTPSKPSDISTSQKGDVSRCSSSSSHSSPESPESPDKATRSSRAGINKTLGSDADDTASVRASSSPPPAARHHLLRSPGLSVRSSRLSNQVSQRLHIFGNSSGSSSSSSNGGSTSSSNGGSSSATPNEAETDGRRYPDGRARHGRCGGANPRETHLRQPLQGGAAGSSTSLNYAGNDDGSSRHVGHVGSSSSYDDSGAEGSVGIRDGGAGEAEQRRRGRRLGAAQGQGQGSTSGRALDMQNSITAAKRSFAGRGSNNGEPNVDHYSNSSCRNIRTDDEHSSTGRRSRYNSTPTTPIPTTTTTTSRNISTNSVSNSNNTRSSSSSSSSSSKNAASNQETNPWVIRCTAIDMEASYPYLDSFAEAVRSHAASGWHPIMISAAMNHAVKLREGMEMLRTDCQVIINNGGDGQSQRQRTSKSPRERDEETLRRTLDNLYDAYLPYIKTMINSRYAINALWVCAKTGYWGAAGSPFVPELLARLRQNRYALLWRSDGQAHANLWWALSQYSLQSGETETAGSKSLMISSAKDHGSAAAAVEQSSYSTPGKVARPEAKGAVFADGYCNSNVNNSVNSRMMQDPSCTMRGAAAASRFSSARGGDEAMVKEEGGRGAGETKGFQVAAGGMDLLRMSAAVLKTRKMLEEDSFKPQQFSNIIIAAARLQYADDPQLIDHMLTHMVKHPGPFKPQAISNTIYGLSELYGNGKGSSTVTIEVLDDPERDEVDARHQGGMAAAAPGGDRGSGEEVPFGRLPPSWAGHIRSLLSLALKLGLHSFSPQELSNTIYSLAQLGLRMRGQEGALGPAGSDNTTASSTSPAAARSLATKQHSKPLQSTVGSSQPLLQQLETARIGEVLPEDCDEAARRFVVLFDAHIRERLQPSRLRHSSQPFDAQSLSNITWALTTIGQADVSFYTLAVQAALYGGCMDDASPQEWTILLWTLANRTYQPPRQLIGLLHRGVCRRSWSSKDLQGWPILLWSLAMLDMYDDIVVSWIERSVTSSCVIELDPQGLATGLFSLAAMPEGSLKRHAALVEKLVKAANRVEPQGFGLIGSVQLWLFQLEQISATTSTPSASSNRGEAAAHKVPAISPQFSRKLRTISVRKTAKNSGGNAAADADATNPTRGNVQNLATAEQRHLSPALVAAARHALLQRNLCISAENASSLQLSVYSHLRSMMNIQQVAEAPKQDLDQQRQGRGRTRDRTSSRLCSNEATDREDSPFASASAVDGSEAEDCALTAESAIARMISDEWCAGRSASRFLAAAAAESPAASADLSVSVRIVRVAQEWLVEALALRVDICVWLSNGRQVVVEVDGPSHYFANQARTRRPKTALRDRHLSRYFGVENMKTVPYWKWDEVSGADAKTAYLTQLLGLAAK